MIASWTTWKKFPNAQRGAQVDAPIGPGIYEVRDMSTGDLVAFDASPNVADALSALLRKAPSRSWKTLFDTGNASWHSDDLEYRICAAASVGEAKMMAQCLLGRRQVYWRRSAVAGRAGLSA